jgi:hypothetical protein
MSHSETISNWKSNTSGCPRWLSVKWLVDHWKGAWSTAVGPLMTELSRFRKNSWSEVIFVS